MRFLALLLPLVLVACQPAAPDAPAAPVAPVATPPPAPVATPIAFAATAPPITVYKTPTCGCCKMWVEHLEQSGFTVETHDLPDLTAVKDSLGVPRELGSCHTATVAGYAIEGHVPAAEVARLLQEKPDVQGLSVPGMPIGSPGMEVPGQTPHTYDVVSFGENGAQRFATYTGGTRQQ